MQETIVFVLFIAVVGTFLFRRFALLGRDKQGSGCAHCEFNEEGR